MKKRNAKALDIKYGKTKDVQELPKESKGMESFPKYDDYEYIPGVPRKKID